VRVFNQKDWPNIPPKATSETPAELDWDMWSGPAPLTPYNANHHHYWNHYWNYSGGDIINDGVHQMDLARWLIGKKHPLTVYATGGRYAEKGDFETPDTQICVFEFDDLIMTFELTLYTPYMLKSDIEMRNQDIFPHWPQNATRIEIYGSKGLMIVGRHGDGWQVFHRPHERQPVVADEMHGPFPDDVHQQNFVDSIRSRQRPNADIEDGHLSTLLCQYANISYRLGGRKLSIDPATEQFVGDDEANGFLRRDYRGKWTVPTDV
jgi:predicted dehydrogenase